MEHWDLSKIFPSIDDAKKALEDLHEKCMFFKLTYRKEMAFLNDEELYVMFTEETKHVFRADQSYDGRRAFQESRSCLLTEC